MQTLSQVEKQLWACHGQHAFETYEWLGMLLSKPVQSYVPRNDKKTKRYTINYMLNESNENIVMACVGRYLLFSLYLGGVGVVVGPLVPPCDDWVEREGRDGPASDESEFWLYRYMIASATLHSTDGVVRCVKMASKMEVTSKTAMASTTLATSATT